MAVTVLEAVTIYSTSSKKKLRDPQTQQQLLKFVNWCGTERNLSNLSPSDIEGYGKQVGGDRGALAVEMLQEVKNFLAFAKKEGLVDQNLSQHLRIRKSSARSRSKQTGSEPRIIELTASGYNQLLEELESRKAEKGTIATDIGLAGADGDVRENAPLEAAREQMGMVDSRITEIENALKAAVIIDTTKRARRSKIVGLGSKVVLKDMSTGRETRYTIVSAAEAKPLEGKISDASPVGKSLIKKAAGQEIEVDTPRGKLRYLLVRTSS